MWINKILKFSLIVILITGWIFSGWPQIFNFPPKIQQALAVTDTYSTAGAFTWTAPANVYSATVACWGGGGGGGVHANQAGGGGGGGAYALSTVSVTPGTGYAVVIGAGAISDSIVEGGDSTFASTVVVADGGIGTGGGAAGTGGTLLDSTGDVKFAGGDGGISNSSGDVSGGGGEDFAVLGDITK